MMRYFSYLVFFTALISCTGDESLDKEVSKEVILVEGNWRLEFKASAKTTIPANFSVIKKGSAYEIEFSNAEETILAKDVDIKENKIIIHDPFFNTWFEGEIINSTKIAGYWYRENREYKIPFIAQYGNTNRFKKHDNYEKTSVNISGRWEVDFSKNEPNDHFKAIGLFQQVDDYVTGTFITETGDYRYLEGNMYNNNLYLSCFDGSHLFLFKATYVNGKLTGGFWSGNHWEEPWVAERNETFELTDPDSLTFLKEGYTRLEFTFPDISGKQVSLEDTKYEGKVVIVNIMGPWCPNCKDETAYLTELYNKNKDKGLEVIALSFDRSNDYNIAKRNLEKVRDFFDSQYDFLVAGQANKIEAAKSLPMLNHVMSYPTSIFIDRNGRIRKIRTGFYGPGTGDFYSRHVERTNDFVEKLLLEKKEA